MICPNYKNKEVFDGFNEIIEAFGGKPMTEEEFRSSELRNQRTGLDYSAMEATYKLYHRNNGNLLDLAPNGKASILFLTLLSEFGGDRAEAIKAKSAVYSDSFRKWFGDWLKFTKTNVELSELKLLLRLVFERIPLLKKVGSIEEYAAYLLDKFPDSVDKNIYWHGTDADMSDGFNSAKRGKGSGAPETQSRNDFYLAKLAWTVLQYVSGVNRNSVDKNGFTHWNKLWWELKEIMSNGRRENNDWKDIVIGEDSVRQAIPNKKGIFNRDAGGSNGKWLKERKADYGYENKSDKEFFEEILGVKWGTDTFNTWIQRNADIFKSLEKKQKGIYPAIINTLNPIREKGQNTYYEEQRGLFTQAETNGNDAILGEQTDNEFGSDVAVVLNASEKNVHFVGTSSDIKEFKEWLRKNSVSKVVDENGEPLVVYHGTDEQNLNKFDNTRNIWFASKIAHEYYVSYPSQRDAHLMPIFVNIKNPSSNISEKFDSDINVRKLQSGRYDGVLPKAFVEGKITKSDIQGLQGFALFSNQIKSAVGNREIEQPGTGFSTTDDNIYKLEFRSTAFLNAENQIGASTFDSVFDPEISAKLLDGNIVSSRDLIQSMLNNGAFDKSIEGLAVILQKHNIAVKIDKSLGIGTIAETATSKNGESIILINPSVFLNVSKKYAGITLLHELIHAVTVNAINNPQTKEQKAFVKANKKILNTLRKAFKGREYLLNSSEYGAYALTNEKEFAATFITDEEVRNLMYLIARQMDKDGGVIQILKDFVNAISNLLINRSIFASNEEILTNYQNNFYKLLEGQEMQKTGTLMSRNELKELCGMEDSILSGNEAIVEATREINEFLKTAEHNKLISIQKVKQRGTFENISDRLLTRISALRTSTLPTSKKQAAINNTKKLLDMYINDHTPRYAALRATVSNVIPQILEDLDYLRDLHESRNVMDASTYMYQYHSMFGTYKLIFNDIRKFLLKESEDSIDTANAQEIIQEYNLSPKLGSDVDVSDIQELLLDIDNISGAIDSALTILEIQNNKIIAKKIEERAKQSSSLEGAEYAALLLKEHKFEDVSGIWTNFGSIDSSTNEALRILSALLNDANKQAHNATISVAQKLVSAAKALKRGESLNDIYETYNGKRTGYVVREVNFGHFYAEYDKQMEKINKFISEKFGIVRDKDDRKSPDSDGTKVKIKTKNGEKELNATEAWNILRNEWLSENCHRKYTKEYYDAWANVPLCAKDALDDINSLILTILVSADAIDEKGYRHLDKLTDAQWKEYNKLQIERKYLYSDTDMFGNKKEVNDVSYEIYKALLELDSKLGIDTDDRKKNVQAWKEARQRIIDDPNKTEADLRDWDIRNSRLVFRKDEGHDVWQLIKDELDMAEPNYGSEYESITNEILNLLKPYRLQNGEILADEMTEAIKNQIKNLLQKRYEILTTAINNNANLKTKHDAKRAIFDKYIEFEDNAYIEAIKQLYYKQFTDEDGYFDESSFYAAMMEFGFFNDTNDYSLFSDMYETFELYSWNKHAVAKDKEKYMQYEPGDGWIDRQTDSKWINPEFKKYEYYGATMIPVKEKYANKQWDKIKKLYDPVKNEASGSLGQMYKVTVDTIKESNELQTNRLHHDNFLLPQVMASSMRRLIRARSGFLKELFAILSEKLGFRRDQNSYIDAGIGDDIQFDAEGNYIKPKKHVGSYADGRSYNTIPQYYTKRLEDPSMISSDLVDMLISYYRMSKIYNEKSKIKDDCEAIVDRILSSVYTKQSNSGDNIEEILGLLSNSFKAARRFLDMQMYGQYTNRFSIANGKYEVSIALQTLKQYTTAVNLGMNLKVAAVGFMTSLWVHLINACTGQKYSKRHMLSGFLEVLYRILINGFGLRYINNHQTNDKLMLLMEESNASQQGEKKGVHTNRNVLVQGIIGNLTFGMMSGFDFLSKSNILVSTMKAHKYVDGEFLTFDDLERFRTKLSDKEYSEKLTRWNNGRSLYSIFSGKNNKLHVEEDYKKAWEKLRDFIFSRIEKYAEDADGMVTQLLKALMTQNFLGAFFLIHRQYLGLMLQLRWGERVYDYDTHQYKNSIFRTAIRYGAEVFKNSVFGSGITGAIAALSVLGAGAGTLSLGAIVGTLAHYIYRSTHKGAQKKSISEINRLFFGMDNFTRQMIKSLIPFGYKPKYNNPLDEQTYLNQRQNFYDIKRILCEVLLYNLFITPVANLAAAIADDDDDNKFIIQMLAYCMRAFQWESYTAYRPNEVIGAIKSPTAATSSLEKAEDATNSLFSTFVPYFSMNLLVPSVFGVLGFINDVKNEVTTDENYYNEEITRGAYAYNEFADLFYDEERGWTRREKAMFKLLPFHNLYELIKDSKSKRRYIENQIMHIKQDNKNGNNIIGDYINNWFINNITN